MSMARHDEKTMGRPDLRWVESMGGNLDIILATRDSLPPRQGGGEPRTGLGLFLEKTRHFRSHAHVKAPSPPGSKYKRRILINPEYGLDQVLELVSVWDKERGRGEVREEIEATYKRKIISAARLETGRGKCLAKYYDFSGKEIYRGVEKYLLRLEPERNFINLLYLKDKGFNVTVPVALLVESRLGAPVRAVLFMEELGGAVLDYQAYVNWLGQLGEEERRTFIIALAHAAAALHRHGFYTHDLEKNAMIENLKDGWKFYFLDFDFAFPWRTPNFRRSAQNVKVMLNGPDFNQSDVALYIKAYLVFRGKPKWQKRMSAACRKPAPPRPSR